MEMNADGIECDVQESRDGVLVVFHDPTMRRLTGNRTPLRRLSLAEIKRLDVGRHFSAAFIGERVPTLAETLAAIPAPFRINLEIKAPCARKMVEQVRAIHADDRVLFSSFDHAQLAEARRLDAKIQIGVLIDREPDDAALRTALRLGAVSLNLPARRASRAFIARAHRAGLRVYLYTVNDPKRMARLGEMGADGLFTNYPDRLSALR